MVRELAQTELPRPTGSRAGKSPLSLDKQLLITLWIMGSQETIWSVAARFGTSGSATYCTFRRVVEALCNMSPKIICWPTAEDIRVLKLVSGV